MESNRIVQVYKPAGGWLRRPPGLGDFIRGACHLHELARPLGLALRLDLSRTDFAPLIVENRHLLHAGSTDEEVSSAGEYFREEEHADLLRRIEAFARSGRDRLHVCTNLGAWNRLRLPPETVRFIKPFYDFVPEVSARCRDVVGDRPYEVLCVRCGDGFFRDQQRDVSGGARESLLRIMKEGVLPAARSRIVVLSDSLRLKSELATQFGLAMTDEPPAHGAFGNALPVAVDLQLLKNATHIHHINLWKWWWSGFSHYTSRIFSVPSTNYTSPLFVREDIDADGARHVSPVGRIRLSVERWRRSAASRSKRLRRADRAS